MAHLPPNLAKLQDIHLPAAVSPWALAPGWYLLIILLASISVAFFFSLRRIQARRKLIQQPLQLLKEIEISYKKNADNQVASAAISELLKRVALMYYPRSEVAGLQGETWIKFLTEALPPAPTIDFTALLEYPYQPSVVSTETTLKLEALFEASRLFIEKQRGKTCLN